MLGSGVPKVGAPVAIETAAAKVPKTTGVPGLISCVSEIPAKASAKICVTVPVTVTGDMAPAKMKGEITVAWLLRAYTFSDPNMVPSKTMGELTLIRLVSTQF